jgi:hypothetical protein
MPGQKSIYETFLVGTHQSEKHQLGGLSSKGRFFQGTHHPREHHPKDVLLKGKDEHRVDVSPTDVSLTESSWMLRPLNKASLGYCVPD